MCNIRKEYSKYEIATLLRDYSVLMMEGINNPKTEFLKLFEKIMINTNRSQYASLKYYHTMVEIYAIQLTRKYMTVLYDNLFPFLSEDKINKINISNTMFVNQNDRKRFSNRQIITYIRNALNHSDNNELYKIIEIDGIDKPIIEIKLNNTKPIPFHVRISANELAEITNLIRSSSTFLGYSLQSDKPVNFNEDFLEYIYLRKFYSNRKLTEDQIKSLESHFSSGKKTKGYEYRLSKKGLEYKDFYLNPAQKRIIREELEYWKMRRENNMDILNHILLKSFPFSIIKERQLFTNLAFMTHVQSRDSKATSLFDEACKCFQTKKVEDGEPLYQYINKYGIDKKLLYDTYNLYDILAFSNSIYYGYLFDTLITDNDLELNGEMFSREKIRDSFVHMRWYKGINGSYQLYDWGNSKNDEFNPNSRTYWSKRIKFRKMVDLAEKYYQKDVGQVSHNINFPIETGYSENNELIVINLTQEGKSYFYTLDPNKEEYYNNLYYIYGNLIPNLASREEKIMFLESLDKLPVTEKEKHKDILDKVKNKLLFQVAEFDDKTKEDDSITL